MLLLPIGRDDGVIQRHAWISYAIIALNVVIWLATAATEAGSMGTAQLQWRTTMRYYLAHPYLNVPDSIASFVPARLRAAARAAGPAPQNADVRAEQKTFDEMAEELSKNYFAIPRIRWSYIPSRGEAATIFTSMFLHTSFLHLVGNMLFFFMTGPFIEDVYGRPLFAFLYLSGGAAATLWFASKHPTSDIPLMGASGAIAAIMGATLVRFLTSKFEFIFIPFWWRPNLNARFFLPAFVVLPFWFVMQYAFSMSEEGSGVAFSAHVGGFVYGVCVALIVRVTGFEAKFVAPVVAKQTTWTADGRLVQAMAARDKGDMETARRNVAALLAAKPNDVDALRFAVDISRDAHDVRSLDTYATRLLNGYAEQKQTDLAKELIGDLASEAALPRFWDRAAQFAERSGERDLAIMLYERLCSGAPQIGSLVKLASLKKLNGDLRGARAALNEARQRPDCSPEWQSSIDAKLAQLG
jgi:membrane associated rhomboid family serine protease